MRDEQDVHPQADGLRPTTRELLHAVAENESITDFPVTLTRDEARYLLDLVETPGVVPSAWLQALESGLRYSMIAAWQAKRSGFTELSEWRESHKVQPIASILECIHPRRI